MKLRQQSAISPQPDEALPASWENAENAVFMQEMFQPAQFNSKETVTEAEIDFCPTAMVGAMRLSRGEFSKLELA